MKLFITGANGFLGNYVVSEAIKQGHSVRALVRPASNSVPKSWFENENVEVVRGDLRNKNGLNNLISGCDSVVHLAAVKAGDLYEQFSGTVIATENLLSAMIDAGLSRIVLISSFSVYEYQKRISFSKLDETSLLAADPFVRDEYCQTKLLQEKITVECAKKNNWRCVVLRPGVIFGRNNLWTARLGSQLSDTKWLSIGSLARLPLTYVENCASAIILSAVNNSDNEIMTLNVVDGQSPTQWQYIKFLKKNIPGKVKITFIPWLLMRFAARCASIFNTVFLHGNGKIPGLFVPERLHARCKPLRYPNTKITTVLKWKPEFCWKDGVRRSLYSQT